MRLALLDHSRCGNHDEPCQMKRQLWLRIQLSRLSYREAQNLTRAAVYVEAT